MFGDNIRRAALIWSTAAQQNEREAATGSDAEIMLSWFHAHFRRLPSLLRL